jgi:hypothetical protein
MHVIVHPADIQDRDGGALVMATLFGLYPFLLKLYADGGYQGPVFQSAVKDAMDRGQSVGCQLNNAKSERSANVGPTTDRLL